MPTENQLSATETLKPDFGKGRYSALMKESFADAKHIFGLEPAKAEKLAREIASDFGAAMASAPVDTKISRSINKDGQCTLAEAAKVKYVTVTPALFAMRAIAHANECGKFGFVRNESKWTVGKYLSDYFAKL